MNNASQDWASLNLDSRESCRMNKICYRPIRLMNIFSRCENLSDLGSSTVIRDLGKTLLLPIIIGFKGKDHFLRFYIFSHICLISFLEVTLGDGDNRGTLLGFVLEDEPLQRHHSRQWLAWFLHFKIFQCRSYMEWIFSFLKKYTYEIVCTE